MSEDETRWTFGPFELWPLRGSLRSAGVEVSIAPKPLALLAYLIESRGRVVPTNELLEAVWPGVSVSSHALRSVVRDLRRALRDDGARPRFVVTARGRGLRFVHEVEASAGNPEPGAPGATWRSVAAELERALHSLERLDASRGASAPARSVDPRARGDLLVALAQARWAAGATFEARQVFVDVAAIARRIADAEFLAHAALGFAGRTDVTPGLRRDAVALLEEALELVGPAPSPVRAELLARLGTELYHDGDGSRADALTGEGVRVADQVGDPAIRAYARTARHFTLQRPQVPVATRRRFADEAIELVGEAAASDVLALALQERLLDALELGEGALFRETLDHYGRVVKSLDQPFFLWIHSLFTGNRTLLEGRVSEAEERAHASLALGQQVGSPNAGAAYAAQLFAVRLEQDRLGELADLLEPLALLDAELPILRAGLAAAKAASASPEGASAALAPLLDGDLDAFPRDHHWLPSLALLAPGVAASGRRGWAQRLLEELAAHAGRSVVLGHGAAVLGAVDHHMGLLAAALGERDAANAHLARAEAIELRSGARLRAERSQRARVRP